MGFKGLGFKVWGLGFRVLGHGSFPKLWVPFWGSP